MMISVEAKAAGLPHRLFATSKRVVYATQLLLDRRIWLYLAGDAYFLFAGLLVAIDAMGRRGLLDEIYPRIVVAPLLVLGLPAISGMLALERRAGSLDLALAVPSTERYFLRRIAPICLFLAVQGWIVLLLAADGWDLVRALYQCTVTAALIGALALFWAVRLKTSGAVLVASAVSVGLLTPWVFYSPTMPFVEGAPFDLLGVPLEVLAWAWKATVQTLAVVILFLYARTRLRRPESMLA